ncbi:GGDEF domain-containing protein [uncultured Idiomarina sp.]|uniref:GGDEF domain-containing protein n=1 Tax=uncultured Idiomarina sp. TaxID=352961 RepID=UPI0025980F08|nr:GGDEF domain-containing protein [uncultured Idiomarina sp.]
MYTKKPSWIIQLSNWRVALMILVMALALLFSYQLGSAKALTIIDFFDVLGEASTLILAVLGLILMVSTRPQGRVTEHFYSGGLILIFSLSLDLLDEFVHYPDDLRLISWLESLPQPLGLMLIAIGALEWRKEHLQVTRQLATREKVLRDHQWLDPLTTLYTARYFHYLLQREIADVAKSTQPLCIAHLNLTCFSRFNHSYGSVAGDQLLHHVSELISLLLRPSDCVCREHSDRFLILLPNTDYAQARQLLKGLANAITNELDTPAYLGCQVTLHEVKEANAEQAIDMLHEATENTSADTQQGDTRAARTLA